MKKKIIIILVILVVLISIMVALYFYGLSPTSNSSKNITFTIESGDSKKVIVDKLKDNKLIKSKYSAYIYLALNSNLNLQAGIYSLSQNLGTKEILNKINNGEVDKSESIFTITFVEGKRLISYVSDISKTMGFKEEDILKVMNDKAYLKSLMTKYWFLTDNILNEKIYYPLEGYLYPSTYEFYKDSTIKDVIEKMLDGTYDVLEPLKNNISSNKYNIHELLTMASIVEQEGVNRSDRAGVAGVFYNRLNKNITIGSDATTYYAVNKDYSVDLTNSDLSSCNGYNTRGSCVPKLPVGPICSPSKISIEAAVNPAKHDYLFFVADKDKKTYFTKTNSEHEQTVTRLKNEGKWYEYN